MKDRIVIDPEILAGKPVIAGTRISVEFMLIATGVLIGGVFCVVARDRVRVRALRLKPSASPSW